MCRAEDQELSERRVVLSCNMGSNSALAISSQSSWSESDWWAWYSPDVRDGVVAHLALDSGRPSEIREFGEKTVDLCAASVGLDARNQ
jgi:hypothetical protein